MKAGDLVDHIIKRSDGSQRFIIAVAGPPGAGKSTLSEQLVRDAENSIYTVPYYFNGWVPFGKFNFKETWSFR